MTIQENTTLSLRPCANGSWILVEGENTPVTADHRPAEVHAFTNAVDMLGWLRDELAPDQHILGKMEMPGGIITARPENQQPHFEHIPVIGKVPQEPKDDPQWSPDQMEKFQREKQPPAKINKTSNPVEAKPKEAP